MPEILINHHTQVETFFKPKPNYHNKKPDTSSFLNQALEKDGHKIVDITKRTARTVCSGSNITEEPETVTIQLSEHNKS